MWSNRQSADDLLDKVLDLALRQQATGVLGPSTCLRRVWSKDRTGHLPDMFSCMPDVNDLDGLGKVVGGQMPNPDGPVPQDHQLTRPLQSRANRQGIEQLAKVLRLAATSHLVLLACLIDKHPWS